MSTGSWRIMRTIKSFTEAAKGPRRALALCLALALLACLGRGARAEMAPADTFAQEAQQLLLQMDGGQELSADLVVGYLASEAGEINPVHCNERDMVSLNQLVFESVVELDETQKPVPLLADSWSVEGNVWTFRIAPGRAVPQRHGVPGAGCGGQFRGPARLGEQSLRGAAVDDRVHDRRGRLHIAGHLPLRGHDHALRHDLSRDGAQHQHAI